MKKGLAFILAICLLLGLLPTTAFADGQQNAVAWAQDRLNEGWMEDYDLENGCQDVDLIKYYYDYLGEQPVEGYASVYVNAPLPSGWSRSLVPQPGDIAVWGANVGVAGQYGHVGIVTEVNSNRITYVATNDGASRVTSHEVSRYSCSCYIHPVFKENTYNGYGSSNGMLEISWLINGMNVIGAQSAGTVDVYVNGSQAANDVNFFSAVLPVGAYYEIRDIKALSGYTYGGISFGSTLGMISGDTSVRLIFNSVAPTPTPTPTPTKKPAATTAKPNVTIKSSGKLKSGTGDALHAQPKVPEFSGRVLIIDDKTPLRSSPSTNGSLLATLAKETALEYLEYKKDSRDVVWYKVQYEKKLSDDTIELIPGWVSSKKTSFRGNAVNHVAGEEIVVVDGQEWVRDKPDLKGKGLEVAYCASRWYFAGEGAVDDRGIEWYKVEYKKTTAWISSLYAMFVSEYNGSLSWKQGGMISASYSNKQKNPAVDPARAFDNVSFTAWATGVTKNYGIGQWIQIKLDKKQTVKGFYIVNGYNKGSGSNDAWEKHSRVKKLQVYCDNKLIGTYELYDTRKEQYVSFGSAKTGRTFRFVIRDVYPGSSKEVCISDIILN